MKRIFSRAFLLILVCCPFPGGVFAQVTFKDYFNERAPLTYLGIDFSEIKVAGQPDVDVANMVDKTFSYINTLIVNQDEAKKYDLPKFFHKVKVERDISFTEEHNLSISLNSVKPTGGDDENRVTPAMVEKIVSGYNFVDKEGMGVMVVTESFNLTKQHGTMYIVFVDMPTSKVIYSQKFTEKAGGFGVRNYWAKTIYNLLDEVGDQYKKWKKSNGL